MKETWGSQYTTDRCEDVRVTIPFGCTSVNGDTAIASAMRADGKVVFNVKRYSRNCVGISIKFSVEQPDRGLAVAHRSRDTGYDNELVGMLGTTLRVGRDCWSMTIESVGTGGVILLFTRYPQ